MRIHNILVILAVVTVIGGIGLIMNGNLFGIVMFLVGASFGVVALMRIRSAAGYENDDFGFNGVGGTGRQQSEVNRKEKDRL